MEDVGVESKDLQDVTILLVSVELIFVGNVERHMGLQKSVISI